MKYRPAVRRGETLAEALVTLLIAAIALMILSAALAGAVSQHIKNESRFARDPDAAVESLSDYRVSLSGMSVDAPSPSVSPSRRLHMNR